jgi:hypothetical protein
VPFSSDLALLFENAHHFQAIGRSSSMTGRAEIGSAPARKAESSLLSSPTFRGFYNGRLPPVNLFTRGLSIALCGVGLLGVVGCGEDNQTEAQKLAKTAGDPGPANPKSIPTQASAGSGTEADRVKVMMENQKNMQKNMQGNPGKK